MDATMTLLVQGCACAPTADPVVTAAMTSTANPNVAAAVACDAGPYVEFDTVLEQMAEQLQAPEPRHGAEPTAAAESARRNGYVARAACTDPEVDTQPAQDDDGDGDEDEDADGSGSTVLRQMMVIAAGPAATVPIQTPAMCRATRPVEGAHIAVDQANGSTVVQGGCAAGVTPENAHTSARVGRDEPALSGSSGSVDVPVTEPGTAPRVQERTAAAVQEAETARPEGRTVVLPDMRGTADRDETARVVPERLTMAAAEEHSRVSQQPGDGASGEASADRAPVRGSVTVGAERPVDGMVRTAPQTEPRNAYTSVRVGRDEPARNGSPRSMDIPATEPGMAPRVQEHLAAAMQQPSTALPEGRTMVLPDMRGTADSDGSERLAPERLTMAATEEHSRVSQQPGDRAMGRLPADTAPVRESVTVGAERPVDGRVRTAPQVEPKDAHTSARVGRDEPALSGFSGSVDVPVTEPGKAPRVQERAAAMQQPSTARSEGRTMVLPDMRGTSNPDGSERIAPERLTMAATEEHSRVSQQPGDRAMGRLPADTAPVRESVTVGAERPVDGRVRTAPQVEPKDAHTSARVGRDEPALSGSSGSVGVPVTEPGKAPRVQERTTAAMQQPSTARSEGRTMVLPDMRGTSNPDGSERIAPERLTMAATEEHGRVSQQPGDRAMGRLPADTAPVRESVTVGAERPVDGRVRTAPQVEPESTHTPARVGRDEPALSGSPESVDVPVTESGMAPREQGRTVAAVQERDTARLEEPMPAPAEQPGEVRPMSGDSANSDMSLRNPGMAPERVDVVHGKVAKAETAELRQTALRPTAPRRDDAMTALVESPARHRNLPNPLWDEGLSKAGRREPEIDARPELAAVVGPARTTGPAEGPDVFQTPQAGRQALTEPAGSSVTRQIAAHVSARAALGGGEFRARLVPEHLGSVQIRVRVVGGVCTADIRADDAEVAQYIESHSSDLKVSLAENGIDLTGLSVSSRSRAQEGWGAAALSHSEPDWSAPSWNGANARQQYAAAAFAGGNWRDGRGERRGALMESGAGMADSHSAVRQSGSPSPDELIAARWVRGYARIDYLA